MANKHSERELAVWIDENCQCRTCAHAAALDPIKGALCEHPELPGFGWLPATSRCECHHFADPALAAELRSRLALSLACENGDAGAGSA